jgi:NgoMIV restriction enzyme
MERLSVPRGQGSVPNIADTGQVLSITVSTFFLEELLTEAGVTSLSGVPSGQQLGRGLEQKVAEGLQMQIDTAGLPLMTSTASVRLTDYWPFQTPPGQPVDPEQLTLYNRMGRGYLIQPDVIVYSHGDKPFAFVSEGEVRVAAHPTDQLFACISVKSTIRSDRSQSSRYEGIVIGRWRRARPPHFVVVTAEPVVSRIASLAWGLGELDCVYHVSLPSLYRAVLRAEDYLGRTEGSSNELKSLIDEARLRDLSMLFDDLFGDVLGR